MNKELKETILNPIFKGNPITVLVLGICSSLAVTVEMKGALVMALSVTIVTGLSSLVLSMMRNTIPNRVRIIVQLVVVALMVILVDQFLKAYAYGIDKQLSVYIGLIITNCIVMGRIEAFALGNKPIPSLLDGLANGVGYGLILIVVAFFRELFGSGTLLGFLGLIVLFAVLRPDAFATAVNARNILEQVAVLAIIAVVQTVVMVVGDFDLSVGTLAGLVGVVTAQLLLGGTAPALAVAAGLGVGLAAGALNGLLVAYLGLSAFIATLATMTSFGGLALLVSGGTTLFGLPPGFVALGQGRVAGLPVPVLVAAGVALVVWFALARTVPGRLWYAVGGNAEAARLSGVNTRLVRFGAFLVSGTGAALAGILLTARLASGHPTAADAFMLSSIAAVFLGMTLSRAGVPTVGGTAVGLGIVGVLGNGLNLLQVNSYVQQVLTGAIIVAAVSLSRLSRLGRAA